jgi:hypothetical protein
MAAVILCCGLASQAQASVIVSATPTLTGGTLIGFDGLASGTIIQNQYAGVTFGQVDGGTPQIDNPPYLYGYHSGLQSGTGVLTGSTNGGAEFPTIAGLTATFGSLQQDVQVFFSDTATLGSYPITVYGANGNAIESVTLPDAGNVEDYVTFEETSAKIASIQIGPSSAAYDAFAIDDLSFNFTSAVPEPSVWAAMVFGFFGLGAMLRSARRKPLQGASAL